MPSVAQESPSAVQCKKRRREDGDHIHSATTPQLPLFSGSLTKSISAPDGLFYSAFGPTDANSPINIIPSEKNFDHHGALFHHHASPLVRKIIPLPASKRQRVLDDEDIRSPDDHGMRRRLSSPSQQRQLQEKSPNPRSTTPSRVTASVPSARLMDRCHICGRKPARKSDLDSFADCQGCSQRTCYVCIRECLGWRLSQQRGANGNGMSESRGPRPSESPESDKSFTMVDAEDLVEDVMGHHHQTGMQEKNHRPQESDGWAKGGHRQVVCSQCCVERGVNGEVVCLGCLAFIEG